MRTSTHRNSMLGLLACFALGACTQIENPGKVQPGSPTVEDTRSRHLQRIQFEDVPVPRGFEYVTRGNRSFSYARGGVRVGRFEYWGRESRQEAAAFFRETMVLRAYGWQIVSDEDDPRSGVSTLNFHKSQQDCEIKIDQGPGETRIHILVTGMNET